MGLDMYLYAKKTVSSKYDTPENQDIYKNLVSLMGAEELARSGENLGFSEVMVQVAYWRKANAIHDYFVKECADGNDECQQIWVSREKLDELVKRCDVVLKNNNPEDAKHCLPTASGFFFGSTEYDEWYFSNVKQTKDVIEKILNNAPEDWEFIYQASW